MQKTLKAVAYTLFPQP